MDSTARIPRPLANCPEVQVAAYVAIASMPHQAELAQVVVEMRVHHHAKTFAL
jgi:hypothetical protein